MRTARVGPRKLVFNLDDVAAMVKPLGGNLSGEERAAIAELIADSPDPTDEQVAHVRQVLYGAQARSG